MQSRDGLGKAKKVKGSRHVYCQRTGRRDAVGSGEFKSAATGQCDRAVAGVQAPGVDGAKGVEELVGVVGRGIGYQCCDGQFHRLARANAATADKRALSGIADFGGVVRRPQGLNTTGTGGQTYRATVAIEGSAATGAVVESDLTGAAGGLEDDSGTAAS